MGFLDGLLSLVKSKRSFCDEQFPQLWGPFVEHFVDFAFCDFSTATPKEAGAPKELPTHVPAADRLVAIGDLHGDLGKARAAFRAAGLTDEQDHWVGGKAVCVQVGDVLDRGDEELRILYFLERLQAEAKAAGGQLYVLNGNHETMNIMGNHRYATLGATREIVRWQRWQVLAERLKSHCGCSPSYQGGEPQSSSSGSSQGYYYPAQPPSALAGAGGLGGLGALSNMHAARTYALQPGATITRRFFANHPTVLQVGSTVFVHGGVLPAHVEYGLDRINKETREWMLGHVPPPSHPPDSKGSGQGGSHASSSHSNIGTAAAGAAPGGHQAHGSSGLPRPSPQQAPGFLRGATAIVWARDYSAEDEGRCDCDKLANVLKSVNAERMVVGHTIQDAGINAACGGRVLRVDVGMSAGCGDAEVEVLEIMGDGDQVRRLREGVPPEDITLQLHEKGHGQDSGAQAGQQQQKGGVLAKLGKLRSAMRA